MSSNDEKVIILNNYFDNTWHPQSSGLLLRHQHVIQWTSKHPLVTLMKPNLNPLLLEIPTEFTSERLHMRCYQPGDGEMYLAMLQANREHLAEFLPQSLATLQTPEDFDIVFMQRMAEWHLRNLFIFSIWHKNNSKFVGETYLANPDWAVPCIEVGYFVVKDSTRQGIASEALKATVQYAFDHLEVVRVELQCAVDNIASRRVAESCGFVLEGQLRLRTPKKDGTLVDRLWYGLLKADGSL